MRRTEALQGVRMIKFVDILGRYEAAELGLGHALADGLVDESTPQLLAKGFRMTKRKPEAKPPDQPAPVEATLEKLPEPVTVGL